MSEPTRNRAACSKVLAVFSCPPRNFTDHIDLTLPLKPIESVILHAANVLLYMTRGQYTVNSVGRKGRKGGRERGE